MIIRPAHEDDLDAVYGICLVTGDSGRDASGLYSDPRLIGHIYAAPYVLLAPHLAFVVADEEGVAGYVVGTEDARSWERRLEQAWWPSLRRRYVDPDVSRRSAWTPDQCLAHLLHHPKADPAVVCGSYPAHLHMNVLPRLQGQGVGFALLDRWIVAAASCGVRAAHVGVSPANIRGARFWTRAGFAELQAPQDGNDALWLGRLI
ncbi:GNAT family N-acetyltransferase [Ciceribacter thiooxidans]|uniref:GNAT family N-acetyltransferase n=1 Tax=Ciceribacter thiooxidans TaxID=1969821 RepID=A0ABV7HWL4_9HYPH|nr:GNAT family N-acetyltransferase [Ciceribacter thiooxidans]